MHDISQLRQRTGYEKEVKEGCGGIHADVEICVTGANFISILSAAAAAAATCFSQHDGRPRTALEGNLETSSCNFAINLSTVDAGNGKAVK